MLKMGKESETLFTIHLDGRITAAEMNAELDKLLEMSADVKGGRLLYDVRNVMTPLGKHQVAVSILQDHHILGPALCKDGIVRITGEMNAIG